MNRPKHPTKTRYLLAEDTIDHQDIADLIAWLETEPWLTQGELVRQFEERWADWLGTRHALMVNSGSSANLLMYYALLVSGRLRNRKVIVPAVSWATTVAPALQFGFEPIMCDAEPRTLALDPNRLEDLLKEHGPAAVILVHILGVPGDMAAIADLQERYEFLLMEDCCAAIGSQYDGRKVGAFGDLCSFSFFFGHHISTIEGGMVCTDDAQLHELLLQLRSHGWAKDLPSESEEALAQARGIDGFNRPFTFYQPGFNLRSTDLNAKVGLSQMDKIDEVVRRRVENHRLYESLVEETEGFECQHNARADVSSIAFLALAANAEHREAVAQALTQKGIETRPLGGGNMSRQPFWADRYEGVDFPVADSIAERAFQLPNHPAHSPDDIRYIWQTVREANGPARRP